MINQRGHGRFAAVQQCSPVPLTDRALQKVAEAQFDVDRNRGKGIKHPPGLMHGECLCSRALQVLGIDVVQGPKRSKCQETVPRPEHIANHAMLVVNHDPADPTGPQHSINLSDRLGRVRSMMKHPVRKHQIERIVGKE